MECTPFYALPPQILLSFLWCGSSAVHQFIRRLICYSVPMVLIISPKMGASIWYGECLLTKSYRSPLCHQGKLFVHHPCAPSMPHFFYFVVFPLSFSQVVGRKFRLIRKRMQNEGRIRLTHLSLYVADPTWNVTSPPYFHFKTVSKLFLGAPFLTFQ